MEPHHVKALKPTQRGASPELGEDVWQMELHGLLAHFQADPISAFVSPWAQHTETSTSRRLKHARRQL
jgi:hypothetical protein